MATLAVGGDDIDFPGILFSEFDLYFQYRCRKYAVSRMSCYRGYMLLGHVSHSSRS